LICAETTDFSIYLIKPM